MLKRLEIAGKLLLAWIVAGLLWRPSRKARAAAKLRSPAKILLVRLDNRVGEALLTTPLFRAAAKLGGVVDVAVHPSMVRVLQGHPGIRELIPVRSNERTPLSPAIRRLRRERYDVVVNCSSWEAPSVGPAIVARLVARDGALVGPKVSPIDRLQDVSVPARTDTRSEAAQRLHLLSPLGADTSDARLSFAPLEPDTLVHRIIQNLPAPFAVVNPGGRLRARRLDPAVFRAVAEMLIRHRITPLITWGPGEEELAREVAQAKGAVVAPATTIAELAALMSSARLVVCNNTGPMHLGVAVGAPTFALFHGMEVARWGHPHPPHRMVELSQAEEVAAALERYLEELG